MQSRLSGTLLLLFLGVAFAAIGPVSVGVTDWLWFDSLGLERVFLVTLAAKTGAFVAVGGLAAAAVYASGSWAVRHTHGQQISPDLLDNPLGQAFARTGAPRLLAIASALVGLGFGLQASAWWKDILLFVHRGPFGLEDEVMGFDAGFYVFVLPVLQHARGALLGITVLAAFAAVGLYVLRGGMKVQLTEVDGQFVARGLDMAAPIRRHLGTLAATLLLLVAIGTFLKRYTLLHEQSGLFAGPGYADVHGTLPLLTLQAIATAIASFVIYIGFERMRVGLIAASGAVVLLFSSITSIYPDMVQRFSVLPNELNREAPHIQSHIAATRAAYQLEHVDERNLSGDAALTYSDIEANAATIRNVRLWDHEPLLETFSQVQEIRTYYTFESVDNDRYLIDGELRQIMLSPRELLASSLPEQAQTWVNERMTYTHGYGVALGPVNEVTPEGLPELFVKDLPPKIRYPDDLAIDRPEIYFGEAMSDWVLVGTENPEFDYPAGDDNQYTTHEGTAGIRLGALGRYLFALRFGSTEMLFSGDVTPESRVLLHRKITDRVEHIAPFLRLDSDPYLVVDGGRLVWILDAYTHSSRFPYSRAISKREPVNYLRNAVKVTVDAYDGTVRMYVFDDEDPIARAWASVFPGLFLPASEMPESLRAHVRYPQDFFAVQSHLFATYHMEEHQIFYNREDEWEVPALDTSRMSPYYTVMKLPGEAKEEFILMLPFTPSNKDNLAAWMVARSDGETYGELRVYKFPKERMVYGPRMIVARMNQDDAISEKLSLWNQQGSKVETGTLLVIPVEESLLYVQPLYLRADNGSIPELKRVIVAYENHIAMAPTLEAGLRDIFGEQVPGGTVPALAESAPPDTTDAEPSSPAEAGTWAELARQAASEWDQANAAARDGDWATYGAALEKLGVAVEQLRALSEPVEPVAP